MGWLDQDLAEGKDRSFVVEVVVWISPFAKMCAAAVDDISCDRLLHIEMIVLLVQLKILRR